jgi:hypothetical protein
MLTDFEKKTPSMFIDFFDFFHPPLLVYCSYVLVFSKKSHPPHLFQPPWLLERWEYLVIEYFKPVSQMLRLRAAFEKCITFVHYFIDSNGAWQVREPKNFSTN